MDFQVIKDKLNSLNVRTLVAVMRAMNGDRPLGYDYMKRTKQELQEHSHKLADLYAAQLIRAGGSTIKTAEVAHGATYSFIEAVMKDGRVEGDATGGTTAGTFRNTDHAERETDQSTGDGGDSTYGDVDEVHGGKQGGSNTKSGKANEDKTEGDYNDPKGEGGERGDKPGKDGKDGKDGKGKDGKGKDGKPKAPRKAPETPEERLAESMREMLEKMQAEKEAEEAEESEGDGEEESKFDPKELERLIQAEMEKQANVYRVVVKKEDPFAADVELPERPRHLVFKEALGALAQGLHVLLVGPAGCGKTHMAEEIAAALGLKFRFTGAVASEYKLLGFITANGVPVRTEYREAYEHGGLFLWDELDASAAQAMLSFNAGLANGHQDFPDAIVKRHSAFRAIASANTYGHGADRVYVGRNQLDAASLDRFYVIPMDYDENLEKALYGDGEWVRYVHKARRAVRKLGERHVVSMRAIDMGLRMIKADAVPRGDIERAVLWKQLSREAVAKIKSQM